MNPKVVSPGGIFNGTGEERVRLYYSGDWLRTNWLVQADS